MMKLISLEMRRLGGGRIDGDGKQERMKIKFPGRPKYTLYAKVDNAFVRPLNVKLNKDSLRNRDIVRPDQSPRNDLSCHLTYNECLYDQTQ